MFCECDWRMFNRKCIKSGFLYLLLSEMYSSPIGAAFKNKQCVNLAACVPGWTPSTVAHVRLMPFCTRLNMRMADYEDGMHEHIHERAESKKHK